jgi:nucleoside-diphosphate kinase
MEREFIMIKPNAIKRGLLGEIISRIEGKGLKIITLKMLRVKREQAERQYSIHKGKHFYNGLIEYTTSGPVAAMVVEAEHAVKVTRRLIGPTDPEEAPPGTIRGDYALEILRNVIHASDSPENARNEYQIYFTEEDFIKY